MFSIPIRVYWEDTDAGGVVYHARYVAFLERARSDALRAMGRGQQALQQILPNGTAKMIYIVGEKGIRTEFVTGGMGLASGSVSIMKPTGEMFMLTPANKTYWKTTVAQAVGMMAQAGITPEVQVTRTGELATVGGLKTEKVTMALSIPLPIPPEALAQGLDLAAAAQARGIEESAFAARTAGSHRVAEAVPVSLTQIRRHHEIELLADGVRCRVAKQGSGASAPKPNDPGCIGDYDCVLIHADPSCDGRPASLRRARRNGSSHGAQYSLRLLTPS